MSTLYVDNLQPNLGSQVEIPNLKPLAGSLVQVQRSQAGSNFGAYNSSSFVDMGSGLKVTFTPLYATSKLLVTLYAQVYTSATTGSPYSAFTIFRDGVDQIGETYGFGYMQVHGANNNAQINSGNIFINANSTSPTDFTVGVRTDGVSYTANVNQGNLRSLTVMEIAQ